MPIWRRPFLNGSSSSQVNLVCVIVDKKNKPVYKENRVAPLNSQCSPTERLIACSCPSFITSETKAITRALLFIEETVTQSRAQDWCTGPGGTWCALPPQTPLAENSHVTMGRLRFCWEQSPWVYQWVKDVLSKKKDVGRGKSSGNTVL